MAPISINRNFRGTICIRAATLLSFIALLLLIFVHVGQLSANTVSRDISMAKLNVSEYGKGLELVFRDPINGLYTTNASAPLGVRAGLRPVYKFGLYGYCAYVDTKGGICGNATTAERFQPYRTITSDMSRNYSQFTDAIVLNTTFRSDAYLGSSSHAAYYMVLLGTICAALATFVGLYKHTLTFLISAILAIVGTLFLLVGAAIWTVVIKKAQSINSFLAGSGSNTVPLGVNLTVGSALFLLWAAFACLLGSVIPYMLSCCTFRG